LCLGSRISPLRAWRSNGSSGLISLRVNILREWCTRLDWDATCLAVTEQLQPSFDVNVCGIELCSTLICIQRIVDLIVARFVLHNY
jgi:hypothetical protein